MAAAEAMRARGQVMARLSPECVRHLTRPYLTAGWTPADVMHPIDHRPDGRAWPHTPGVRHPAGWVRYRLGHWLGPHGRPLPSRSQIAAARDRADRDRAQPRALAAAGWRAILDMLLSARFAGRPGRGMGNTAG
jgi:hypothetical protein